MSRYALFEVLPSLSGAVPRAVLGDWPTPVEPLGALTGTSRDTDLYTKREDASAAAYGGNKIRPIEVMCGLALRQGHEHIWATGAFGSNHVLATAIHAPRVGLTPHALLFPQPSSATARANLRALMSVGCDTRFLWTIAQFPFAWQGTRLGGVVARRRQLMMVPGAAVPLGVLGHLSAGLELAQQVEAGEIPAPRHIVLPVGSTCTTAGLLIATELAASLGLGFRAAPRIHGIRVTPWPVTARWRIAHLAARAGRLLEQLGGPTLGATTARLASRLTVSGAELGRGYGHPTTEGEAAIVRFREIGRDLLDTTYSAKAAAYLLRRASDLDGPVLFWSSKSSAPLPPTVPGATDGLRPGIRKWLAAEA